MRKRSRSTSGAPKPKVEKVEKLKVEKYKSHQTPHKPSVLTAPVNRAEKVSMSRIKEIVFGAFWGPGGPKRILGGHFS